MAWTGRAEFNTLIYCFLAITPYVLAMIPYRKKAPTSFYWIEGQFSLCIKIWKQKTMLDWNIHDRNMRFYADVQYMLHLVKFWRIEENVLKKIVEIILMKKKKQTLSTSTIFSIHTRVKPPFFNMIFCFKINFFQIQLFRNFTNNRFDQYTKKDFLFINKNGKSYCF